MTMSERIDINDTSLLEHDRTNGDAIGGDGSQQRPQEQPQRPHQIRRIFQGDPPRGFRIRHVGPDSIRRVHPNVVSIGSNGSSGDGASQNVPSDVNGNGDSTATTDTNIQRIRISLNGNAPEHSPLNGNVNGDSGQDETDTVQQAQIDLNHNATHRIQLNQGRNGTSNADRNGNAPRLRLNIGGQGPFTVRRQYRQGSSPFIQISQQQQQLQSQQERGSQQQQQQQSQSQQQSLFHSFGPNGSGPVHVQVQVDPLAPQPLPPSTATNTSRDTGNDHPKVEDPPGYDRYKCEICYEYLNEPVGCGNCASRFCRACLQRVYDSDKQKKQPTKCPVCRCEYKTMVPDLQIYSDSEGKEAPTLPCRYACVGCTERTLPLSEIANHERVCEHVPVRCRYAPYGCQWIGKRGLVGAHEEFGCKVAPMGKLVEDYRQTKANHTMRMEMIAQQAAASLRMSHVLRQTYTRDNQRKSLSDSFRLVQYCHAVTGLTPHFLMTKDLWVSYWRNNESRAAVVNFCMCLPLLSAALGVVSRSTTNFFQLFDETSSTSSDRTLSILARVLDGANTNIHGFSKGDQTVTSTEKIAKMIQRLQQSDKEELLLTALLGMCVGALGVLVLLLTYIDTKSNISWDKIQISPPFVGGRYRYRFPLVGDVMAITIFTLVLAILEYHEQSNLRALVLWITMVVTSTFFPAMIFSISHYTARLVTRTPRPTGFNMMEMARSVEPCMFGLRFSMMMTYFGVAPTLDATVVLSLVPQTSRLFLKNSLFDTLPRRARHAFVVAKIAIWTHRFQNLMMGGNLDMDILKSAVTFESAQQFFTSSEDAIRLSEVLDTISVSFLAIASLMVTNAFINTSLGLGNKVGDYIALTSQQELSPEGIARGTAKEYSSVGLVVFGTWVMMVGFVLLV